MANKNGVGGQAVKIIIQYTAHRPNKTETRRTYISLLKLASEMSLDKRRLPSSTIPNEDQLLRQGEVSAVCDLQSAYDQRQKA